MAIGIIRPTGRQCVNCRKFLPAASFFIDKRRIGMAYLRARCKTCTSKECRAKRKLNHQHYLNLERRSNLKNRPVFGKKARLKQRHWWLKKRFGISLIDFRQMLASQDGRCAICMMKLVVSAPRRGRRDLACADHDHDTGQVRGILCNRCNTAIGLLNDNIALLQVALNYLKRHVNQCQDQRLQQTL